VAVTPIDPVVVRGAATPVNPADSLVAVALAMHPRLAARRAAVDAATRSIQVERLGARPDFTVSARYGYRPVAFGFNFPDFFSAFVGLRLPIWAWRKQNRLADAARADSTGAAAELRDAGCSSVARSPKPLPESRRHSSVSRSSWTAFYPMRGGPS